MSPEPLILLVEDDPQAREGYAEFLQRSGLRVAQSGCAEDAFSQSIDLQPDAIVTDIQLPGKDGFSLAADLKCQGSTAGIPILAMTAYWAPDIHDRAERAGIETVLLKPCQPGHLVAELQRALHRARLHRESETRQA